LHARLRVQWASGFPCALYSRVLFFLHDPDALRRGNECAYSAASFRQLVGLVMTPRSRFGQP
jgi:hypothetical protein